MTKTTSKTERPGFEIGRWLVYAAAAFQAYHMGRAFHVYDPQGWHLWNVNFGGLLLGAIINVIVAQTALKLPSLSASFATLKSLLPKQARTADKKTVQARSRAVKTMTLAQIKNAYAQFGFYTLLFFSALMVGPALYILWSSTLPFAPFFIGIMAAVGAVAPDVAITVGGFAASDAQRQPQRRSATLSDAASDEQATLKRRSARKPATPSEPAAKTYQCPCNYSTENRYEFSGHTRTCATYKADKAQREAIPVDFGAKAPNAERGER